MGSEQPKTMLIVPPPLARFVQEHPGVEASLDLSDALRDFVADPVDVALRILRPVDSTLIARRVSRLPAVTVAAPAYLRCRGTPTHPSQLSAHDTVAYRHPGSGQLAPLRFLVARREVHPKPRTTLVVNDVDTGCEAATLGLGIVQPPAYYVSDALRSGALLRVLERYSPAPWTLYISLGKESWLL